MAGKWKHAAWDVLGLLVDAKDEIGGLKKRLDISDREVERLSYELAQAEDCELTLAGELRRANERCTVKITGFHDSDAVGNGDAGGDSSEIARLRAELAEVAEELMATQVTGEYERGYELGSLAGEKEILSTREERDQLRARIRQATDYLEDPAWSTFDARRSMLRGILRDTVASDV